MRRKFWFYIVFIVQVLKRARISSFPWWNVSVDEWSPVLLLGPSACVCVCVCVSVPLWVSLCHFRSLLSVSAHIDRAALEGYHVLRLRQGHWCRTFHFLPHCETNDCASYVDQMLRWQRKLIHKWLPKCICKQIMSFQRASCSCLRQQRRNWNKYFHHFVIAT